MTELHEQLTLADACTPETLVKEHPELFTVSQLNWLIKTRKKNGLAESGAILKISGKIYILRTLFFAWFRKQIAL